MNGNENTKHQNLWDSAKAQPRGTGAAINACFFKKETSFHFIKAEKEELIKLKANRRK